VRSQTVLFLSHVPHISEKNTDQPWELPPFWGQGVHQAKCPGEMSPERKGSDSSVSWLLAPNKSRGNCSSYIHLGVKIESCTPRIGCVINGNTRNDQKSAGPSVLTHPYTFGGLCKNPPWTPAATGRAARPAIEFSRGQGCTCYRGRHPRWRCQTQNLMTCWVILTPCWPLVSSMVGNPPARVLWWSHEITVYSKLSRFFNYFRGW
jgi:hypothetical protein